MSATATARPMSTSPLADAPATSELFRFNVEQYERMVDAGILTPDDRVELINGYVVTKMPKGPGHVWAVRFAERRFEGLLGPGWCVRHEAPAQIPPLNEPEPDLVIARGGWETYLARHPRPAEIALVVEVSDTTYHRDRYEKLPAFAQGGIPVYWIVNLSRRLDRGLHRPDPGRLYLPPGLSLR